MFFKCTRTDDMELQETKSLIDSQENRTFDYVLVANEPDGDDEMVLQKQKDFIQELEKKNITVTKVVEGEKIFFGLHAPSEMLDDYQYLLKVSDSCNWSGELNKTGIQTTRIRILHFILHNTTSNEKYLEDLIGDGVFETMFCLHDKEKQEELEREWARWSAFCTRQRHDLIWKYFGEKVALYYLWLGRYTLLLVPAAALGVVVFLYALAFFHNSPLIHEVCNSNITMCPLCDKRCKLWNLSDTCTYAKVNHLFDNEGTVVFSMFMAIWATVFLELWKRQKARYVSDWKVYDWCEEEEELIMEIINNRKCGTKKYKHSYWRSTLVLIMVTVMLMVIIGLTYAIVVFRVVAAPLMSESKWEFLEDHANSVAVLLGAVLHYLTIQIMTKVNKFVALKLAEIEKPTSLAARERSFTVKMFTFQFFTLFSSLFYVAFFLGKVNGHPGNYLRILTFRLEECHPSGCLTDLFIQMSVIMVLKQTINNFFELLVPCLKTYMHKRDGQKPRQCSSCHRKTSSNEQSPVKPSDPCLHQDLMTNYLMSKSDSFSLFNEFLEMVIQFSFTTIFVAAFPLAPLLALINNIIEIRLDAKKMVFYEQRLIPRKTNNIGVWIQVLEAVGVLAVIANGLVIGITSDFIPRLVYRYRYGPCANGQYNTHCMQGYINNTLSTAYMIKNTTNDFILPSQMNLFNVTPCSYRDYRDVKDYALTPQYWLVLAVRFAFIVLFEHVVVVCKFTAAWFIPANPINVKNKRMEEKLKRLKDEFNRRNSKSTEV